MIWRAIASLLPRNWTARRRAGARAAAVRQQPQSWQELAEAHYLAIGLLESLLDKRQLAQFRNHRTFDVIVHHGKRRYRITEGSVYRLEGDVALAKYCILSGHDMPSADLMLAKKLLLEADEGRFLRIANRV